MPEFYWQHNAQGDTSVTYRAEYVEELTASAAGPEGGFSEETIAAGIALVARDTGRVLMLQRAVLNNEEDVNAGKWELPGGRLEDGESPHTAALREFCEETGIAADTIGEPLLTWLSANGIYQGFVHVVGSESDVDLHAETPDDPDGDTQETLAFWEVADLPGNAALRPEVNSTPWGLLQAYAPTEEQMQEDFDSLVAAINAPTSAFLPTEELPGPTPWGIQEDGVTVDGHLALWASCHVGYPGCVKPPREEDFTFFNLGEAVTADGQRVPVGKVVVGGGHAGPDLNWRTASAAYDETGTAVAVVHATADRWGIRLPGALVADATPEKIDEVRRSPLSGDWRRINGKLRLVAAVGVNTPGFPIPRALVASGHVETMFVGFNPEDAAALQMEADELASELQLDTPSLAAALVADILTP